MPVFQYLSISYRNILLVNDLYKLYLKLYKHLDVKIEKKGMLLYKF